MRLDDDLIRSHTISKGSLDASKARIPRIMHQTYKTETIPEAWHETWDTCQAKYNASSNPPWEYKLWTDETALAFLRREYSWFVDTYLAYPYDIQRADAIRYFVLHYYGGIYLDIDVGCMRDDLEALLSGADAMAPKTDPYGASNDVLLATRRHPLFDDLISGLAANAKRYGTKYPTVMFSTGPMYLTSVLAAYLKRINRPCGVEGSACVIPPELYGNTGESFFFHIDGSSWHGWDAHIVSSAGSHIKLLVGAAVSIVLLLCFKRRLSHIWKLTALKIFT